eukprot:326888_1
MSISESQPKPIIISGGPNWGPSIIVGLTYYVFYRDLSASMSIAIVGCTASMIRNWLMRWNFRNGICELTDEIIPAFMTSLYVSLSTAIICHFSHYYHDKIPTTAVTAPLICLSAVLASLIGVWCIARVNYYRYRKNGQRLIDMIPIDTGFLLINISGAIVAAILRLFYYSVCNEASI